MRTFIRFFISTRVALIAENLFLRKQLALFQERQAKPRRTAASLRLAMVALAKFFELLRAGANPNAARSTGETPLMTAAYSGNLEAVHLLLARGANVNGKEDLRGQTALMLAVAQKTS